jgi:hypothetical protein
VQDLNLHEALAVLPADELEEIADRAASQAEILRAGQGDAYVRGWVIVFDFIAASARYALAARELELSS